MYFYILFVTCNDTYLFHSAIEIRRKTSKYEDPYSVYRLSPGPKSKIIDLIITIVLDLGPGERQQKFRICLRLTFLSCCVFRTYNQCILV